MSTEVPSFACWLEDAHLSEPTLTPEQHALLQNAFRFQQHCGRDYYTTRLLSHFLLHCHSGLKVAQIARLLGLHRSTASQQQGLSSKEVVQAAHHRLAGRAHGKLLPRFAGPVAQFLHEHPQATRAEVLDFIERTWGVRVTRIALYHFLKKYGLDQASRIKAVPDPVVATPAEPPPLSHPVPVPPRDFFLPPPTTPVPSSSCPARSIGWASPGSASRMTMAPCGVDC
jgi:transposase